LCSHRLIHKKMPQKSKDTENTRRGFLKRGAALAAGGALLGLNACSAPEKTNNEGDKIHNEVVFTGKKYEWKVVTTWPPNFPVLGESVVRMAKEIELLSGGALKIQVYGSGELVKALEVFDAVSLGAAQMGHGTPYYWAGKMPSAVFFASIPFGFNAQQMNAWMFHGGGLELWQELYGRVGLTVLPGGNTGVQMGGWFNKEIKTVEDIQGLKMRIPGLGGKVIDRAGGSAITIAGGEVYTSLERGVVDAAEWIGPYHDYKMGFYQVAKYYYYPGWHEPGSNLELMINKKALEELPKHLQEIVKTVTLKHHLLVLSEFEAKNNFYLKKLTEEHGVQLRQFPDEVLHHLKTHSEGVLDEITSQDEHARRTYDSMKKFKAEVLQWNAVSEKAIVDFL